MYRPLLSNIAIRVASPGPRNCAITAHSPLYWSSPTTGWPTSCSGLSRYLNGTSSSSDSILHPARGELHARRWSILIIRSGTRDPEMRGDRGHRRRSEDTFEVHSRTTRSAPALCCGPEYNRFAGAPKALADLRRPLAVGSVFTNGPNPNESALVLVAPASVVP
jgi:hypothetical protein